VRRTSAPHAPSKPLKLNLRAHTRWGAQHPPQLQESGPSSTSKSLRACMHACRGCRRCKCDCECCSRCVSCGCGCGRCECGCEYCGCGCESAGSAAPGADDAPVERAGPHLAVPRQSTDAVRTPQTAPRRPHPADRGLGGPHEWWWSPRANFWWARVTDEVVLWTIRKMTMIRSTRSIIAQLLAPSASWDTGLRHSVLDMRGGGTTR
jgi:hypothetical protein